MLVGTVFSFKITLKDADSGGQLRTTYIRAALGIWMNLNYQWMKGWGNNAA